MVIYLRMILKNLINRGGGQHHRNGGHDGGNGWSTSIGLYNNEAIESLLANAQELGQVIIHCLHYGCSSECGKTLKCELKLNPNVQLIPTNGSRPSKLIQTYNINLPPGRTFKNSYGTEFTLIFTGLPKNCTEFDFIEPDEGGKGWEAKNIKRNKTDLYKLFISPTGAWEGETIF